MLLVLDFRSPDEIANDVTRERNHRRAHKHACFLRIEEPSDDTDSNQNRRQNQKNFAYHAVIFEFEHSALAHSQPDNRVLAFHFGMPRNLPVHHRQFLLDDVYCVGQVSIDRNVDGAPAKLGYLAIADGAQVFDHASQLATSSLGKRLFGRQKNFRSFRFFRALRAFRLFGLFLVIFHAKEFVPRRQLRAAIINFVSIQREPHSPSS